MRTPCSLFCRELGQSAGMVLLPHPALRILLHLSSPITLVESIELLELNHSYSTYDMPSVLLQALQHA